MTNRFEKVFTVIVKQVQIKQLFFLVRLENKKEEK